MRFEIHRNIEWLPHVSSECIRSCMLLSLSSAAVRTPHITLAYVNLCSPKYGMHAVGGVPYTTCILWLASICVLSSCHVQVVGYVSYCGWYLHRLTTAALVKTIVLFIMWNKISSFFYGLTDACACSWSTYIVTVTHCPQELHVIYYRSLRAKPINPTWSEGRDITLIMYSVAMCLLQFSNASHKWAASVSYL